MQYVFQSMLGQLFTAFLKAEIWLIKMETFDFLQRYLFVRVKIFLKTYSRYQRREPGRSRSRALEKINSVFLKKILYVKYATSGNPWSPTDAALEPAPILQVLLEQNVKSEITISQIPIFLF